MATPKVSPFTTKVVAAMRKMYPESLADSSFDNTGLLLEAPYRPHLKNSVLLTVDLTQAVADEAIARKDSIIITYHPIIFRPLKSLTLANTQQSTLLRLAQEGISVYSPHTAVDAVPGGLNDWLCDALGKACSTATEKFSTLVTEKSAIKPIKDTPPGFEGASYGRILKIKSPQQTLGSIISRVSLQLELKSLSVAVPQWVEAEKRPDIPISTIGICVGSGGSLLNGLDVDLLLTGELSHHEALAAIEQGKCVITTFHSNTERAYLKYEMTKKLQAALEEDQTLGDKVEVAFSSIDRDPYEIISKEGNSI